MIRFMLVMITLLGCTRSKLEQIPPDPVPARDDKLSVEGEFCTRSSAELAFPIRVLFVVDVSDSMAVTDPVDEETGETSREAAVRATWSKIMDEGDHVAVGMTLFSSNAQSRTVVLGENELPVSYFTQDLEQLETATAAMRETERTTNYVNALDEAYFQIRTEMLRTDEDTRSRSRFEIIFLSDGLPDVGGGLGRQRHGQAITNSIRQLTDLVTIFGVKSLRLHTVYLSSDLGAVTDAPARELLANMADEGNGTFRNISSGERLDFLHIDLSNIQRLFTLTSFAAFNTQMVRDREQIPESPIPWVDDQGYKDLAENDEVDCADPMIDSDADGLADVVEKRIGTDPFHRDSDRDGLGDRIEWGLAISGLDPLDDTDAGCFVPDPYNAEDPTCIDADEDGYCDCPKDDQGECIYPDTDGDGLLDCEEIYVGTSQTAVDTDADGLPDAMEYRFRTDTVSPDDVGDLDWDLTPNGTEVRTAGNPLCDDANVRSMVAYDYVIEEEGVEDGRSCYRFEVSRITLLPTAVSSEAEVSDGSDALAGPGRNRILFFAGEQAFDEPDTFAGWRMACVEAKYEVESDRKIPISGRMELTNDDFLPSEEFVPAEHCVRP